MRALIHKHFDGFTKTCKNHWCDELHRYSYETNQYNIFIEYWEGRRFIGALYGIDYDDGGIYVDIFFINEKYQNKGNGKFIINMLSETYEYIYVESTFKAYGFYKKCGFIKKRNQQARIYPDTIDMYLHRRISKQLNHKINRWIKKR